jgi:phosphonate transport system substrate-binding protein
MHRRRSLWLLPAAIIAATAFAGAPALAQDEDDGLPEILVAGFVPSREANVLVTNIKPLTDYLTEELDHLVWGNVTQSYAGLVIAMETGQAQIGVLPPFGMVQAMDRAGVIPILQTQRDGEVTYHAQWFTNNPDKYCLDEPVAKQYKVADGKVVAWDAEGEVVDQYTNRDGETYTLLNCNGTDVAETEAGYTFGPKGEDAIGLVEPGTAMSYTHTGSTSGFIFPALQLIEIAGLDPLEDLDEAMNGGHDNSVVAVCNGDSEVGVSFDDAREIVSPKDCPALSEMVVFALSAEIPSDGIGVTPDLPEEFVQQLIDALLAFAETPEGADILDSVYQIDTYGLADVAQYELVREAADKVEAASLN